MLKTILGVLAAAIVVLLYLSYFVVDEKHKALVLRSATSTAWWKSRASTSSCPSPTR